MRSEIGKLLSFTRVLRNDVKISDVKIDTGGGVNTTAEEFAPAGDDSFPLKTDYILASATQRSGGKAVHGFIDPINEPKAQEGDKRIYARNAADGTVIVDVWLKNDGTAITANENGSIELSPDGSIKGTNNNGSIELSPDGSIKGTNNNGSFELQAGGDFVVNGVTIDTSGNITSPATVTAPNIDGTISVKAATKELAGHVHPAGTPPGNTGPNA